jgi:hypothetical protein
MAPYDTGSDGLVHSHLSDKKSPRRHVAKVGHPASVIWACNSRSRVGLLKMAKPGVPCKESGQKTRCTHLMDYEFTRCYRDRVARRFQT